MPNNINFDTWLIGAGGMSIEYANVLSSLNKRFLTIGRGKASALNFKNKTNLSVITGGLKNFLKKSPEKPLSAIVAVDILYLFDITSQLIKYGVKYILVEKPGSLSLVEIKNLHKLAREKNCTIFIAYNRRFYNSTKKAKEIIKNEGGVLSFNFDFTELVEKVKKLDLPNEVKKKWFLSNSTHVVDLAFYLCGFPQKMNSFVKSKLSWHPSSSIFCGSGQTVNGALFSYSANWGSPGRWGLEIITKESRLLFQPIEELRIQQKGSFKFEKIDLDNDKNLSFKHGIYSMTKSFLNKDFKDHCSLSYQIKIINYYFKIASYN